MEAAKLHQQILLKRENNHERFLQRGIPFLRKILTPYEIALLSDVVTVRTYEPGDTICKEGTEGKVRGNDIV
jgi:hypothetical protein